MIIKMLEERKRELSALSEETYPKGWSGEVDDDIATEWLNEGAAKPVINEKSVMGDLVKAVQDQVDAATGKPATVAQLKSELDDLGIDYDGSAKKAELQALLDAAISPVE